MAIAEKSGVEATPAKIDFRRSETRGRMVNVHFTVKADGVGVGEARWVYVRRDATVSEVTLDAALEAHGKAAAATAARSCIFRSHGIGTALPGAPPGSVDTSRPQTPSGTDMGVLRSVRRTPFCLDLVVYSRRAGGAQRVWVVRLCSTLRYTSRLNCAPVMPVCSSGTLVSGGSPSAAASAAPCMR